MNLLVVFFQFSEPISPHKIGTIAGNLSIKHQHRRFPSDLFVILEGVGANITIIDAKDNTKTTVDLVKYLTVDMTKKVIVNVKLPMLTKTFFKFRTYKVGICVQFRAIKINRMIPPIPVNFLR